MSNADEDEARKRKAIGRAVRWARREADLTQAELGAALGISRDTVIQIESGRASIRVEQLARVAELANVQPAVVLARAGL